MKGFVYLIQFSGFLGNPETHTAHYYLGSALDLSVRMNQHRSSAGAAILRACNQRGISYKIIKLQVCPTVADARELERKLKAYKNHARIADLDWNKIMNKPTLKLIREQIAVTGKLEYLAKVRDAFKEIDPVIASELEELILVQKVLK